MLKNYLIVAYRNLIRQRGYSLINIIGLSTGLTAALLLLVYIQHEISYDRMHENGSRIYRITSQFEKTEGETMRAATSTGIIAPEIRQQIPEVESICRIKLEGTPTLWHNKTKFEGYNFLITDTSFFSIFSFEILQGEKEHIFDNPYGLALSESMAKNIFQGESPIGKIIKVGKKEFQITAVFRDIPATSHIQFDAICSNKYIKNLSNYYSNKGFSTPIYLLFKKGTDMKNNIDKTTNFINSYIEREYKNLGIKITGSLQNLWDIHLGENMFYDFTQSGKKTTILIFGALAFFILFIAVINFVNLFIAKSEKRIKEVGIRKTLGALPKDLQKQFWGESAMLALISLAIAFVLLELCHPYFASLTNRELTLEILTHPLWWGIIACIILLIIIISGSYPVFYLSRCDPANILKGAGQTGKRKNQLKTFLVFFQFAITIFLITNIIVINTQVKYLENKELGFAKDQILIINNINGRIANNYESLRERFLQNPNIHAVTASESYPGRHSTIQNCYPEGRDKSESTMIYENRIQREYISTYQMEIVKGRDFNPLLKSDTANFIINETAAKKLNLEEPVGKRIIVYRQKGEIIGIVKDFNFQALYSKIEPIVFTNYSYDSYALRRFSIRLDMKNRQQVLRYIEEQLKGVDPNYTFDYHFLNDYLDNQYKEENQTMNLIISTSAITILLSILGLFALTSFIITQRTKEIGIRKTLGASEGTILVTLSSSILRWVLLANLVAWPLSIYFMRKWLTQFAYSIDLESWMFLLAGFAGLSIAGLTICLKAIKASRVNPILSLKSE